VIDVVIPLPQHAAGKWRVIVAAIDSSSLRNRLDRPVAARKGRANDV